MTWPGFLDELFTSRFMPHGHCYLWTPGLVWLHAISDGLVALSYTTIPFTLYVFARRRRDIPFNWMFLCFATFIIACGATHYLEIWTLWYGTYWLSGTIKAVTALASVPTAILLVRLVPRALAIPHPAELRDASAALRESEARFRAALDGALDAFFLLKVVRDAGRIVDFILVETNPPGERLCKMTRAQMTGRRLLDLFPADRVGAVHDRYVQVVETRRALGEEFQYSATDETWWEHQLVPVEDGLAVTLRDITPRKAAERAVQSSEERFRSLLEAAPDAMVISTADGKIALVNAQTEELFGFGRDELIGQPVETLVPGRLGDVHVAHRAHFAADRHRRPMAGGLDLVGVKKDGSEIPIEISLSPLEAHGERFVTAAIRDVAERNRAEQTRARLAAIVASTDDAIYSRGLDGTIETWNAAAERLYGYGSDEIVGQPGAILLPPDIPDALPTSGEIHLDRSETMRRRKDGSLVEVALTVSPIRNGSALVGHAFIARDVSAQKAAERQIKSSLREKVVLLKEVHHRVKNNLQVISSLLNLQAAKIKDPVALEMFRDSQDRVRSIAFFHEHVYQSKDLSRVDLGSYLRTLADHLLKSYGGSRGRVKMSVLTDEHVGLGVDKAIPCGLIVNELVSNALKHGFREGQAGTISVELRATSRSDLLLAVADDGVGLPAGHSLGKAQTLGHQLVLTLIKQLGGHLEVVRGAPPGDSAALRPPLGEASRGAFPGDSATLRPPLGEASRGPGVRFEIAFSQNPTMPEWRDTSAVDLDR